MPDEPGSGPPSEPAPAPPHHPPPAPAPPPGGYGYGPPPPGHAPPPSGLGYGPPPPGYPPPPLGYGYGPPPPGYPPGGYVPSPGYASYPSGPAPGLVYAGFGVRLGAALLDVLFFFIAWGVIAGIAGGFDKRETVTTSGQVTRTVDFYVLNRGGFLLAAAILAFQFTACWYWFGRSPGQAATRITVRRAADGGRPELSQAVVRGAWFWGPWLAGALAGVLTPVLGLVSIAGLLASLGDPRKQGWHDRMAGTVTVRPWP